jgi:hypothetical protein
MPRRSDSSARFAAARRKPFAPTRRCLTFAVAVALMLTAGPLRHATVAGAAIQAFSMSPTSGPPGTSVHVSGTGCAPGILLASSQDFVQVSSTTGPTSSRFAVTTNGSWNGSFVVPANAPAAPATVTALCFSDALQSLQTIYLPAVFTVTTGTSTTVATTPPTTQPHAGSTIPGGSGSPGGAPPTAGPGDPGSSPADPVSTPGDRTAAVFDGNGSGSSNRGGGSSITAEPTTSGTVSTARAHRGTNVARAADLNAPSLAASGGKRSAALGWLVWLLLISALIALVAFAVWIYWTRRHAPAPDAAAELQ